MLIAVSLFNNWQFFLD